MKIKRTREDFIVEEILSVDAARAASAPGSRRHILYRLEKRGLGTEEAIERVAAAFGVPPGSVGFGGLKDRHAITVQYVTIDSRLRRDEPPEAYRKGGISLERAGCLDERLYAEGIAGNRFLITVRDLTRADCRRMDEARRFLSLPGGGGRALGFVNYFGGQRFGSARHGRGFAARRLIEGDFEGALRLIIATPDRKTAPAAKAAARRIAASWGEWETLRSQMPAGIESRIVETLADTLGDYRAGFLALPPFIRRIVIEAYQSHLWNETAGRFVAERCPRPFIAAPDRHHERFFPETACVPKEFRSLAIPLFSPKTRLAAPWREAAESALEAEGIALGDLRVPGRGAPYFGETPRRLFAEASAFSLGPLELDETAVSAPRLKRRLRFTLPRGAYATTLLAALGARD